MNLKIQTDSLDMYMIMLCFVYGYHVISLQQYDMINLHITVTL